MRIRGLSFHPRPITTAAAVAMLALLLSLGAWQGRRAEEKRAIQAMLDSRSAEPPVQLTGAVPDPAPLLYRRVRARGEWIADRQFFVDNRIHEGRAGFEVVTPLRLAGAQEAVLVDRGWIARDSAIYPRHPEAPVPAGPVEAAGTAIRPPARVLELSPQTVAGDTWQNLSIERYAAHSGLALLPVVVLEDHPAAGLAPANDGARPDAGIARHLEYELTWYSLAATTLVLWLALNTKRIR
jgi:surfeit locus 1 family protein